MLIANLTYRHGTMFSGEYRIRSLILNSHEGNPYVSLELGDMTGTLRGYLWIDTRNGPPALSENDHVKVSASLRFAKGQWTAKIDSIESIKTPSVHPVALIPLWECPEPCLLYFFHETVQDVKYEPLNNFLKRIFIDDAIAFPYITFPASMTYHHAYPGGLLEHSIECAHIIRDMSQFSIMEKELGIVATLLHDIGKIKTMTSDKKLSQAGFLLSHDIMTLEILGPHLQWLDGVWPDGSIAIRYLLTWKNHRCRPFPMMTMAEAVTAADRISSSLNREFAAFSSLPSWRNSTGSLSQNGFWRPVCHN